MLRSLLAVLAAHPRHTALLGELSRHHAIDAVGSGLAIVLGNMQVVVVGIGAWPLFGERPATRTTVALPIIPVGVVLGILTALSYGQLTGIALVIGGIALATLPLGRIRRRALTV